MSIPLEEVLRPNLKNQMKNSENIVITDRTSAICKTEDMIASTPDWRLILKKNNKMWSSCSDKDQD